MNGERCRSAKFRLNFEAKASVRADSEATADRVSLSQYGLARIADKIARKSYETFA